MNRKRFNKKFSAWALKHRECFKKEKMGEILKQINDDRNQVIRPGGCYKSLWEGVKNI